MTNMICIGALMMGVFGVARGLTVGVAVTGVSLLFNPLNIHNLWVMLSMILLTAILFSLAGFINGIYAKSFDDISIVPTFVLTPLTYLGGIFYSITMLPPFWQHVSLANPILYMINAFRFGFLGVSDIPLAASYGISISFILLLYALSIRLLRKGHGIRT